MYLLILCEDFCLLEQLHKNIITCCLAVKRHVERSLYLTCFYSLIVMDILCLCVVSTGSGVSTQPTMSTQHHDPPSPLICTQPPRSSEGETNSKHSVDSSGFLFLMLFRCDSKDVMAATSAIPYLGSVCEHFWEIFDIILVVDF